MTPADRDAFVLAHTSPGHVALVPEIELLLAAEMTPLWHMTEDVMAERGIEPPYWAFAWPGGQFVVHGREV